MSKNPIKPFWSWNDKLERDELIKQIEDMHKNGIEGFFMHARGGLVTEYMGEEWFELTEACLDKADELGMDAWAYDENGWPSGFANGIVPRESVDFQQKWLLCETVSDKNNLPENIIGFYKVSTDKAELIEKAEDGCTVIYYDINKYYIDTFNPDAIKCFIENTHQKYYERFGDRFGTSMKGFFTDEPQYGNHGHAPWSSVFENVFEQKYGYALKPELIKLYFDIDGYEAFRSDFYNMVSDTFRESFMKQMYDWCTEHNCKLTGHMMNEDNLEVQVRSTGGVMSCYEYFHEPGVDWLCRYVASPLVPKQLGSAAYQLGRKTLTESFALCGWDVSLNELKWIAQWQFVNGITMLCPHLEGYTLRGARKRDYPASLFSQLPWFNDAYCNFADYSVKLGELLDSGRDIAPLLVVNMIQSAYIVSNPEAKQTLEEMDKKLDNIVRGLSAEHILHHYGDEVIMSKIGKVEDGKLKVGLCEYEAVLLPSLVGLKSSTVDLFNEYINAGGKVYIYGDEPHFADGRKSAEIDRLCEKAIHINSFAELKTEPFANFADITSDSKENGNIHYCEKKMPDGSTLYYLVNLAKEPQNVVFKISGEYALSELDVAENSETPLCCHYGNGNTAVDLSFAEYGSYVLTARQGKFAVEKQSAPCKIKLNNIFEICECSENALTLDTCEYSIDDGEWQPERALIRLQNDLLELKRNCKVALRFRFFIEKGADIGNIALCVETPEKFSIKINEKASAFNDCGYYIDKSIRKTDISNYVTEGENIISMECDFYQDDKVYEILFAPNVHESETNKLTFDTELESIYILGNFGVKSNDDFTLGEKKSVFTGKSFCLTSPVKKVDISNITVQGYWFFAGTMSLKQTVSVNKKPGERYMVSLSKLYCPAAELYVNGKKAGLFDFAPYMLDVTDLLNDGENEIIIRLLSGNRNLLGPHHKVYGEGHAVTPASFTDKHDWSGWCETASMPTWTDNYSFVIFGAEV